MDSSSSILYDIVILNNEEPLASLVLTTKKYFSLSFTENKFSIFFTSLFILSILLSLIIFNLLFLGFNFSNSIPALSESINNKAFLKEDNLLIIFSYLLLFHLALLLVRKLNSIFYFLSLLSLT